MNESCPKCGHPIRFKVEVVQNYMKTKEKKCPWDGVYDCRESAERDMFKKCKELEDDKPSDRKSS